MKYAFNWVAEAARNLAISFSLLNEGETQAILIKIENRFLVPMKGKPIWERIRSPSSKKLTNAWELACDLVGNRTCHLIIEQQDDTRIFRFRGSPDLKTILGECPAFDFSICGMDAEYLLAVNHHDYLIAAGTATQWLNGI